MNHMKTGGRVARLSRETIRHGSTEPAVIHAATDANGPPAAAGEERG